MNKKIFTLLAGVLLLFAMVFSVKAGVPLSAHNQLLGLNAPVKKLVEGPNNGYFALKLDSVSFKNSASNLGTKSIAPNLLNDSILLFMGRPGANGTTGSNTLFLDSLNYARKTTNANQFSPTAPKSEESAASLWCTIVNAYDQGQNITFDFVNKQQKELLEVNVFGREGWSKSSDSIQTGAATNQIPGGISGWEFSDAYATTLHTKKALISYITTDTVAVLCTDSVGSGAGQIGNVVVKIAAATDVKNGKVDGILYFTLTESKPFVLDDLDFNTMFGDKQTATYGNLKFNPDATTPADNLFEGNLKAVLVTDVTNPLPNFVTSLVGRDTLSLDTLNRSYLYLDTLGYMALTNNANGQFLYVQHKYHPGNVGGDQYLQFGFRASLNSGAALGTVAAKTDAALFGQSFFRLVYYPSGDSIYINPYQATYLPTYDQSLITDSTKNWIDTLVQSSDMYTYRADTTVLELPQGYTSWGQYFVASAGKDSTELMTARLKYGQRYPTGKPLPYSYWHKLYVTIQNLTGTNKIVTLSNGNFANHGINTQINFGVYTPCNDITGTKTTVPTDLYLIRNEKGEYLHVPLYSPTDSALWVTLDKDVHPELLPSFQWVVEKRYPNSTVSTIKITNREFEWLTFDNIQLELNQHAPFTFRANNYNWNTKNVNSDLTVFSKDNGKATFVALDAQYKSDPFMGYTWINPDTSIVNLYAFNYLNAIDRTRYIGWNGDLGAYPNTDTLVYVDKKDDFTKMYFRMDTIHEDTYGELQEYGYRVNKVKPQIPGLVTLKKQAYRLSYEDPFKFTCRNSMSLTNGTNSNYAVAANGNYKKVLGKPVFYLRHYYHIKDANGALEPYFALVQTIDTTTTSPSHNVDAVALRAYLTKEYGAQYADLVMSRLTTNRFNPGLFVAQVQDHSGQLKTVLRAEGSEVISTFRIEKDADPIYRRFNTELEGNKPGDEPEVVEFYSILRKERYLFENTGALSDQYNYWVPGKKNYLGSMSAIQHPNASKAIYVDTAYVNRGTGYIKPQYLLMVDPQVVAPGMGCDDNGEPTIPLAGYIRGRYLINAHDSAFTANGTDDAYIAGTNWTRFVFTDAIHANDHLYIVNGADLSAMTSKLTEGYQIDLAKLHAESLRPGTLIHRIHLGTNTHKDCVFQFRLIERGAKDFLIESQTTNRDTINGPMIAPCEGGWIKIQNDVPMISESDEVWNMGQANMFNVNPTDKLPTPNEKVTATNVTIVGNAGSVTVLNAAGKNVVISNVLGQTIANTVLTSDNATVTAPKGIVVVAVEGETAVKTLVK